MKKFLLFAFAAVLLGMSAQAQNDLKLKINNSTIYKVEKAAIWTTTLNQLDVITRFAVTNSTAIYLDGKKVALDQLKPGFKVTIYYYDNPACMSIYGCNVAVKILAYSRVVPTL